MDYLTCWRMLLAADRLTHFLSEIGLALGYESEKIRQFGVQPGYEQFSAPVPSPNKDGAERKRSALLHFRQQGSLSSLVAARLSLVRTTRR